MSNGLLQANSKAPEISKISEVHLGYVPESELDSSDKKIQIPVYLSKDKEMMLCMLDCPYYGDKDDIVLAGTSFFLI